MHPGAVTRSLNYIQTCFSRRY